MNQLSIAIIGHTNTGKTSLIRNLAKERNFGEVRDEPSTTIDVTSLTVSSPDFSFHYIDTPGIEDAMGILEILEQKFSSADKVDEPKHLLAFSQSQEMHQYFEQEIKVIKQLFAADLAIYVVDVRLPYLPKFDNELTLIQKTHKPILPIFNFIAQGDYINEWRSNLKAHGIHTFLEYDTIVPPKKRRLYEQIAIMFPSHYSNIQSFIRTEEEEQKKQLHNAMQIIADFYLNILTYRILLSADKKQSYIIEKLQKGISVLEEEAVQSLLMLYSFNSEDVGQLTLAIQQMTYDDHFFTSDNLINFSMNFGKGATVGAGIFAGMDALAGFTTLGAATATGAILGGITNTFKHYGERLWNNFNNIETYCLNDMALSALTSRMIAFVALLNGRSHAEIKPILLSDHASNHPKINALIESTRKLRAHPNYCQLINQTPSTSRDKTLKKITKYLITEYGDL